MKLLEFTVQHLYSKCKDWRELKRSRENDKFLCVNKIEKVKYKILSLYL